ncbi:collagen alpha-2(I) chain-like [Pithys albifrons albifrons]|uniref:collagen alpha-2(I) chain-like n=1 Tax=Pithys albifrons albifrons TaxID=3385563 RepID=UPI003A5CE4B9
MKAGDSASPAPRSSHRKRRRLLTGVSHPSERRRGQSSGRAEAGAAGWPGPPPPPGLAAPRRDAEPRTPCAGGRARSRSRRWGAERPTPPRPARVTVRGEGRSLRGAGASGVAASRSALRGPVAASTAAAPRPLRGREGDAATAGGGGGLGQWGTGCSMAPAHLACVPSTFATVPVSPPPPPQPL